MTCEEVDRWIAQGKLIQGNRFFLKFWERKLLHKFFDITTKNELCSKFRCHCSRGGRRVDRAMKALGKDLVSVNVLINCFPETVVSEQPLCMCVCVRVSE